ncbi:unnamed protein product [Ilex paraguariensis]|uniref:Pentatricopeptide repeat-containing protein n=1 Tax=Ilex paraguariensis TaxID=185542 RepID=A0ABC8QN92_9AQUA
MHIAVIYGLSGENDFDLAWDVLNEMEGQGCEADVISYTVIIGGPCREGKLVEAIELFEDMWRQIGDKKVLNGQFWIVWPEEINIIDVGTWRMVISMVCYKDKLPNACDFVDPLIGMRLGTFSRLKLVMGNYPYDVPRLNLTTEVAAPIERNLLTTAIVISLEFHLGDPTKPKKEGGGGGGVCYAPSLEARKLLSIQTEEVPTLDGNRVLSPLPKGTTPLSSLSGKVHAVASDERQMDRVLQSVPSPGVGH